MEKSRPRIILSAAISLDGNIATKSGESKLSSRKDLVRVHELRTKVDAILVGKRTVNIDDPCLTARYSHGKNPIRVVLDSKGTIKLNSKIIQTCKKIPTIIAVSDNISKKRLRILQGYDIEIIKSGHNIVDLKKLLHILRKKGIKKLLVEGGGMTNWSFFKQGLVDEIIITITPYILGKDAISFIQGSICDKIWKTTLKLKKIRRIGNEVVLHYTV